MRKNGITGFTYADGSGNVTIVKSGKPHAIEYAPVKPETSSSGLYDGGEPYSGTLTDGEYKVLRDLALAALNDSKNAIPDRIMGSGYLTVHASDQAQDVILAPEAASRKALEAALMDAIRKNR